MRHCNWTIDQEQASLSLFDAMEKDAFEEDVSIPFKTDYQYNVFIDVDLGQVTVKNLLMDYGSNGSISLNEEIFSTLKEQNIIRETLEEKGIQQSGIIGETVNLNREITYTDSIRVGGIPMKNVMLRTGKTVSVGNALLSRFRITIDWKNKYLHLVEIGKVPDSNRSAGFKLGYTTDKGVYVQSVIEQSDAYNKGVRPNMRVAKIDHLDFASGYDFCDYVNHKLGDEISLQLIDSQGQKQAYDIEKTSF